MVYVRGNVGSRQRILRRLAHIGFQQSGDGKRFLLVHRPGTPAVSGDDLVVERLAQQFLRKVGGFSHDAFQQIESTISMPLHLADADGTVVILINAAVAALIAVDNGHGGIHHFFGALAGGAQQEQLPFLQLQRDGAAFPIADLNGPQLGLSLFQRGIINGVTLFLPMEVQHIFVCQHL